jgi:mannose PTS system EIIA component
MSVSLLLITHDNIGQQLLETARATVPLCPLQIRALGIPSSTDVAAMYQQALELVRLLDTGKGVLVLTDLFGSTPANIATQLLLDAQVEVIAGLNLPMLIRTMNYPNLELLPLAQKALSGGHDGVLQCNPNSVDKSLCNEK